jgi:hypothetical protein
MLCRDLSFAVRANELIAHFDWMFMHYFAFFNLGHLIPPGVLVQ